MEKKELIKVYNLLEGMYKAAKENENGIIFSEEIDIFNELLKRIHDLADDEYVMLFVIKISDCYNGADCSKDKFIIKILPVLEYVNNTYIDNKEEVVQKIGALYNSIEDTELQKRCGDILLEASGAFDRVINQATQILEDRIKKKAELEDTLLIGIPLVSKAIHSKIENTIILFSDNADIQEHYSALFKGIIGVYRNPTHHGIDYECSREDALKFCAYIDLLLKELSQAKKV